MKAVVILLGLILYAGLEPPLEQERELSAQCEELENPLDLRTSAPYELQLPIDHESSPTLRTSAPYKLQLHSEPDSSLDLRTSAPSELQLHLSLIHI